MPAFPAGRRERKKQDTRRALRRAALTLARKRGVEAVTVEQITEAADVSERTFFNHFECKEDALLPETEMVGAELRQAILSRPADEPALQTLRFAIGQSQLVREAHLYRDRALARQRLIHDDPGLLARQLAQAHDFEAALAGVLATRRGTDQRDDVGAQLLAALFGGVVRVALRQWASDGGRLDDVIDRALTRLGAELDAPLL